MYHEARSPLNSSGPVRSPDPQHRGGETMPAVNHSVRAAFGALLALALAAHAARAALPGPPVRIGSTLALTGPLAATGLVHKIVGEIYVEQLNRKDGLLGRPVEWVLKDDHARPDLARTLYEQLITVDKVDLMMGPYATANILSAMGVAQRYNKVLIHHTFGTPSLAKYDMQFPAGGLAGDPDNTIPKVVFDALAASAKPPKSVAVVTSKFPSVHFISLGAREAAKKRGLREVAFLEWDFGNRDFGPIAARLKDAKPHFVFLLADARGGRHGGKEHRRQGHRPVAEEKPRGRHRGAAALGRPLQLHLRQRSLQGEAEPERQVGRHLAEGIRRIGRAPDHTVAT